MKNMLKLLSLTLLLLMVSSFSGSEPFENENVHDFLKEISTIMDGCYGIRTIQSSGCLQGKETHISLDFSADYIFSEMHAKKVILDTMREICIRLERSDGLSKLLPNGKFDPDKIQISIKITPKKHHRMFPAVILLESIEKDSKEGYRLVNYVEARDGKIEYYVRANKFSSKRKFLSEETLEEAIADATGVNIENTEMLQIPPIPKRNVIHTEFIFQRTWAATKKKYGINPMTERRQCEDRIELLDTGYEVPKRVSKEESRDLLFLCINEMLNEIHIDDAIQPYLAEGFNENNLEVTLYLGGVGNKIVYPDIATVSYKNGKLSYRYDDPDREWHTKKWVTETFEEALSLVDKEKLNLQHISACSEHYK